MRNAYIYLQFIGKLEKGYSFIPKSNEHKDS